MTKAKDYKMLCNLKRTHVVNVTENAVAGASLETIGLDRKSFNGRKQEEAFILSLHSG